MDRKKTVLTLRQTVLFAMLGAFTFAAKVAMAGLPNIEPVSLFVMLFAVTFGLKALYPMYTYVALEFLFYPANLWNINYLYIWLILALSAWGMRKVKNPVFWALLSGGFGLMFGMLCAPVDVFVGGFAYAAGKWVNGIPFDLLHGAGNFVIALTLFVPLRTLLARLYARLQQ